MEQMRVFRNLDASKIQVCVCIGIVSILFSFALLGQWIAPYPHDRSDLANRLAPPFWAKGGSLEKPLGTDSLGRDILSRIILGAKYSLGVAVISILISAFFGVGLGLVSGYLRGFADSLLMRVSDLFIAFPVMLLGLLMAIVMGANFTTLVLTLVIIQWARFARQVRGEALALRETEFVAQARLAGASTAKIILRHLLPNVMNTVLVLMTLQVGWAIIMESSLSFLGAGIPPPEPAWGSMVADGREYLRKAWWVSLIPGLAILITVLCFNTIGDWIRDRLDPKLKQL
jgi:peptide/nickel transport system permease protein